MGGVVAIRGDCGGISNGDDCDGRDSYMAVMWIYHK